MQWKERARHEKVRQREAAEVYSVLLGLMGSSHPSDAHCRLASPSQWHTRSCPRCRHLQQKRRRRLPGYQQALVLGAARWRAQIAWRTAAWQSASYNPALSAAAWLFLHRLWFMTTTHVHSASTALYKQQPLRARLLGTTQLQPGSVFVGSNTERREVTTAPSTHCAEQHTCSP